MATNQLLASDGGPWTTVGANWTAITGLSKCQVVSGNTEPNTLNVEAGQIYTGTSFTNDHISAATINLNSNATTNFQLCVRMQSGAYSGYKVAIGNNSATIYRVDAGVATALKAAATGLTLVNGDIWEFEAAGSVLTIYQNGKRIDYSADDTYTGGSPGFIQFSSTNLAQTLGNSWRGYSIVQQDGIWRKQGVIIPLAAADIASSGFGRWNASNILYETGAQLISPNADGKVWKMWFMSGGNSAGNQGQSRYAEANLPGGPWTIRGSPVISNFGIQSSIKVSSTYYAWGQGGTAQGSGAISAYTSSDGIAWSLQNNNFLALGAGAAWDAGNIYIQCNPVIISGAWNFLYGGAPNPNSPVDFASGIATSPDGTTTATKLAGNPLISNAVSGPLNLVGTTYVTWPAAGPGPNNTRFAGNAFNPAETVRYTSADLRTFSGPVRSLHVSQLYESVNDPHGNATSCIIFDGGDGLTYNYYIGAPSDSVAPQYYQISLATTPIPLAQIITGNEDSVVQVATDAFPGANGDLSASWATPTGGTKLGVTSHRARATSTGAYDVMYRTDSYSTDHYSEITVPTLANTGSFALPAVRVQSGSNSGYVAQVQGGLGALSTAGSGILKLVNGSATLMQGSSLPAIRSAANDVYRLAVTTVNGLPCLSLYQNDALIEQCVDYANLYPTGQPGMGINTSTLANTEISLWAGGNSVFYVAGNAGIAGATVSYTGTASGSVTADANGYYVITGLLAGSYTITPTKAGYSFSPVNSAQTVSTANISGVNFTATHLTVATPSISPNGGRVLFPVTVTLTDTDSAVSGFAMYYTTDGSTPTTGSNLYSAPFALPTAGVVKVYAVATGYIDSAVASATFVSKSGDFEYRFNFRY
jgi:hypothetical protein